MDGNKMLPSNKKKVFEIKDNNNAVMQDKTN